MTHWWVIPLAYSVLSIAPAYYWGQWDSVARMFSTFFWVAGNCFVWLVATAIAWSMT